VPGVFEKISAWLLDQAIEDAELEATISGLGSRLVAAGIPVCRIVVGRGMAHPVIGLASLIWHSDKPNVHLEVTPPTKLSRAEVLATPFGHMALTEEKFISARLTDAEDVKRFAMFPSLADQGITHYLGLSRSFTPPEGPLPANQSEFKGAVLACCTRRHAGFSQTDIEGLRSLFPALCACIRVAIDRTLVTELLDRYLGRISGSRVLTGQTARGDGTEIDCALLYSDMRNSVALSSEVSVKDYIGILNDYFDCTAGAVIEHGGEVLKFIGDGVLAIFPFDAATRPPDQMCAAALATVREAFDRLDRINGVRSEAGRPMVSFGIGLNVGKVIYGNVGTDQRLDFTATGTAVGLASRCENLTKDIGENVVATEAFVKHCSDGAVPQGIHKIHGFAEPIALYSFGR
jgi:adenylate cyclase